MITYVNKQLEVTQLTDSDAFCQVVYGKKAATELETDDRLDCDHLFELLCDERVVFYSGEPSDLFKNIGIDKTDTNLRQERNIYAAAFLIRSALNSKATRISPNESLLFVRITVESDLFYVYRTVTPYHEYPQLNAWVRKNTIDKLLLTM